MTRVREKRSIYEILWPFLAEDLLTFPEAERLIRARIRTVEDLHAMIYCYPSYLTDEPRRQRALGWLKPMLSKAYVNLLETVPAPPPVDGTGASQPGQLPVPTQPGPELIPGYDGTPISCNPTGWNAMNQWGRGTCCAFAAVACCELAQPAAQFRAADGVVNEFSEEYLYYKMKTRYDPGHANIEWTKLNFAVQALSAHGVCQYNLCDYVSPVTGTNFPAGPTPTPAADADAMRHRFTDTYYLDAPPGGFIRDAATELYRLLQNNKPVAMSIEMFQDPGTGGTSNWMDTRALRTGIVTDPLLPDWQPSGGHCVCVTGLARAGDADYFIIRNSWGLDWATDPGANTLDLPIPQPGYGAVSAAYVNTCCFELMQL